MLRERIASSILGTLFLGLIIFTIAFRYYDAQKSADVIIAQDIVLLANIFRKIHSKCKILNFEHDKNYIDFLNVASFVGSEIGLMNLAFPEKWEGPYVQDIPTIQEKYYMVIKTKRGHFIVPGDGGGYCDAEKEDGVQLSNGKIIGKDIIFSSDSDIEYMMRSKDWLLSENGALAARIPVENEL